MQVQFLILLVLFHPPSTFHWLPPFSHLPWSWNYYLRTLGIQSSWRTCTLIRGSLREMSKWRGFVITNVFPMVYLRLKMKLPTKSSKWTVTKSNFFMKAPKWRRNLWWTSLWSCHQFYVMMHLEWNLKSFLPLVFHMLFLCLHFVTCSHWGQCAF